jgi:Protein of unknown function (DUF4038)/Domain of unknown function (DUF5060)/Putative collagen-binding domain of a collagenase/Zinc carboxypeptidase
MTENLRGEAEPPLSVACPIQWQAPPDGGTPRDPARIAAVGTCAFRIRACAEEGQSLLTHAVSRLDLICRNTGSQSVTVTLHLDLSGDGGRTSRDDSPYGGMSSRDFLFIRPPGEPWRQVNGTTEGWICTVSFAALPGETQVGLSPWYPYGDYLAFVRSLPEHPHLVREKIGESDGGREHWELSITDPAVPREEKRVVFWHAREHGYESFSSFAMEGAVDDLLSDAAAEARRQFLFVLHPMTNVDGVAEGYEYRVGYDYPEPQGTASARLTWGAVDRLRPEFVISWHNWIAPRDQDVLFYTDEEEGQPSRRAWDLFTQRFPSPRAVEHRWGSEANPLRHNWFGRRLSEHNVHQYAMMRYGSRVWGWEMPFWNRSVADARHAGAAFCRAFLATVVLLAHPPAAGAPEPAPAECPEVPRWEMHEFVLRGRAHVAGPFRDAALVGEFTAPSGQMLTVEGFYDGEETWRLRFAPDEEGEWHYLLRGEGVALSERGRLRCVAPSAPGLIRIHPDNPYAFAYADGTPFFPMGDTCYGLYSDSPITPPLRAQYLQTRRAQRFNFVRMHAMPHRPIHERSDPRFWAWGGTPQEPDLDRFNPAFFRGLDELLREMQAVGMNAELLLLNFYLWPGTDPKLWTPERERHWLRYLCARYAAFSNVFLWTIANEYETHPDGKYRLDVPDDVEWAKATARYIKQHDPYRHPVTIHPVISASTRGASPRSPFEPPWRIGPFFGDGDAIDVLSQQTGQQGERVTWDETEHCWRGDVPEIVASLRADRRYRKPVLNTESGYEYLRGAATERQQVHHTDKVRRASWRIVCAGGYLAAGFHGTIGHSDVWNRLDAPNRYTFQVRDEGAAAQLRALYEFFTALPFWRLQPFDGVTGEAQALAVPGERYVLYLPHGGRVAVDLGALPGTVTARWFNPRDGRWGNDATAEGGGRREFAAPDAHDWALLITPSVTRTPH